MSEVRERIVSVADAARLVRDAQASGRSVVMCHGCFDIVHPGHVRHLQHARKLGHRLLVTVTGDARVGKGEGRPLIPQELRAEGLAALDGVDWVAVTDAATAVELLETIRPDVYVKGREYEHNRDPRFEAEKRVVQAYGGRVVFTSGDVIFSSTALVGSLEDSVDPTHAALRQIASTPELQPERIGSLLHAFRGRRILVVGETIRDTYVSCERPDIAGEGPMMTLRPLGQQSYDGGAAIVARHLAAMGASPMLLTPLPPGPESEALRLRLEVEGVEVRTLPVAGRPLEKQRFLVGTNKIMKLDLGGPIVLDAAEQQACVENAVDLARGAEALVVADFGLGFLTAPMLGALVERARPLVDLLVGDVSGRRANLLAMRDMDLLCPSEVEIREALHDYEAGLSAVVWSLLDRTHSAAAIITLGADGVIAFDHRERPEGGADWNARLHAEHVPSLVPHAVDPLGCGDALVAAATLTRLAGGSLAAATVLGSVAAAAEARKLGNAVIGAAELRRGILRLAGARLTFEASAVSTPWEADDHVPAAYAEPS